MSIINETRRITMILMAYEKNPNTPKNKCGGYPGTDYISAGDEPYSEEEISNLKNKLQSISPDAYRTIYTK